MKLINTLLTVLDIVIVILSYTISNMVVWHQKDLSNIWFYIFIAFTVVNLFKASLIMIPLSCAISLVIL